LLHGAGSDLFLVVVVPVDTTEGGLHEKFYQFLLEYDYRPRLVDVLKCLSQDIFAPASHQVKAAINEKYPPLLAPPAFNSLKPCTVSRFPFLTASDKQKIVFKFDYPNVDVILSRTEESVSDSAEQSFHFTWETKITMNLAEGVSSLKIKVNIVAFEFGEEMKSSMKRELREVFEPFVDEIGAYLVLWQRNLLRVPVHKDLVRLSKNLIIVDSNDHLVLFFFLLLFLLQFSPVHLLFFSSFFFSQLYSDPEQKLTGPASVRNILQVLAKSLQDAPVLKACAKLNEFIKETGDVGEHLLKFFQLPEFAANGPVVKVLKCISQEMIYPAVQTLRNMLYEKYPYKDVKGTWIVKVTIDPGCVRYPVYFFLCFLFSSSFC